MQKQNLVVGIILVILGLTFLSNNFFDIDMINIGTLWPLFVLIPGLIFEISYFSTGKNPGLLVPGGILTVIGSLFFFESFTHWDFSDLTWPIYPLAVAVGLFQLYLFGGRQKGLLIPVGILTLVFGIFMSINLFSWLNRSLFAGIILVTVGGIVVVKNLFRRNPYKNQW